MTGGNKPIEGMQPMGIPSPQNPRVTPDELYPYLLRLVLLAQADEAYRRFDERGMGRGVFLFEATTA